MLAWEITDHKQNHISCYVNLFGKRSAVAMNFSRAYLNKLSCELQKYDMIATHAASVRSTHKKVDVLAAAA